MWRASVGLRALRCVAPVAFCDEESKKYPLVIIGAGPAGRAALEASEGRVLVIDSDERALLSVRGAETLHRRVTSIDAGRRQVAGVRFEKCIIATGAPPPPKFGGASLGGYGRLGDETTFASCSGKKVVVLGGSWPAVSLAAKCPGSVLVTPEACPMASCVPRWHAKSLAKRLQNRGVEVLTYSQVRYVGSESVYVGRLDDPLILREIPGLAVRTQEPRVPVRLRGISKLDDVFFVTDDLLAHGGISVAGDAAASTPRLAAGVWAHAGYEHASVTGRAAARGEAPPENEELAYVIDNALLKAAFVGRCDTNLEHHTYLGGGGGGGGGGKTAVTFFLERRPAKNDDDDDDGRTVVGVLLWGDIAGVREAKRVVGRTLVDLQETAADFVPGPFRHRASYAKPHRYPKPPLFATKPQDTRANKLQRAYEAGIKHGPPTK